MILDNKTLESFLHSVNVSKSLHLASTLIKIMYTLCYLYADNVHFYSPELFSKSNTISRCRKVE